MNYYYCFIQRPDFLFFILLWDIPKQKRQFLTIMEQTIPDLGEILHTAQFNGSQQQP